MKQGIVIACDSQIEWMLPWWLHHYRQHNSHPVAFFNLGISPQRLAWCKKQNFQIFAPPLPTFPNAPNPTWEKLYNGNVQTSRPQWLKKPFILKESPFEKSLWLDLDCEVRTPLTPLFKHTFALAKEREASHTAAKSENLLLPGETLYNSGVIAYSPTSPLLQKWMDKITASSHLFDGDQTALSRLLHEEKIAIDVLSPDYNWRMADGPNPKAKIIHWVGSAGKQRILAKLLMPNT